MRISIDADKCVGSGNCENAAREVFELGDDGLARVIDEHPDTSVERRVRAAERGCPTGAITVDDDGTSD